MQRAYWYAYTSRNTILSKLLILYLVYIPPLSLESESLKNFETELIL